MRKDMVNSMNSCPAMKGDCDCAKKAIDCYLQVIKRSSVV